MKSPTLLATLLVSGASLAVASPLLGVRQSSGTPTATQVLQLALTLEHLESTFYTQALANYSESAFVKAGFPTWARGRFSQIADHEATHVAALTAALGSDAVAACTYDFPVTNPAEFVALSEVLESVGESAYLGGAPALASSAAALAAGAAILPVEARHASWVQATLQHGDPWNTAFATPVSGNLAFTLASSFITSCPSSNPALPFTAFPALTITHSTVSGKPANGNTYVATKGKKITFAYDAPTPAGGASAPVYAAFLTGLNTYFAPLDGSKTATIPQDLQGRVFVVITTANSAPLSDSSIIAGPATMDFMLGSNAKVLS